MSTALRFELVTKRFGTHTALADLSFEVQAGEIFGFLGPNGAGKTTAIGIAMGFLQATSGCGTLLDAPLHRSRDARSRVGYVPDAPVFFAGNALQTVTLAGRLNGNDGAALKARATALLEQLELDATGQDVRRFSRGMRQRLAIAQALVNRPALLVLDEPTSALDPPAVVLVRRLLAEARAEGCAVFFSSHQLQEIERLCDRALFLDAGRVLHQGTMHDLLAEGEIARVTLRSLSVQGDALAVEEVQAERPGDRTFRVSVAEQRSFLERAWTAGAELVAVEREHRSLEDLFAERKGKNL